MVGLDVGLYLLHASQLLALGFLLGRREAFTVATIHTHLFAKDAVDLQRLSMQTWCPRKVPLPFHHQSSVGLCLVDGSV